MDNSCKIMITGGYGFVGTYLATYLKQDKDITLTALDIKEGNAPYDRYVSWDNLDNEELDSYDAIIHLAGMAHDTRGNAVDKELYFKVNTGLTQRIFDKYLKSKTKIFIFFSSVKAVADTVEGEFLTEDAVPYPKTPYGESKLRAEEYINSKEKDIDELKKVYILRPAMIHGPGNKGNLNLLYKTVSKRIPWPLGKFDNLRSFTSIENVCYTVKNMIRGKIPQGTYQIADDTPLSTNELIRLIAESQNRKPLIINMPQALIRCMAKAGDVLKLPLNSERLKKLTESYIVSNLKLKGALGIDTMPVSSTEGMIRTLNSFKNKKLTNTAL